MKPIKRFSVREEILRKIDDAGWVVKISIKLAKQALDKGNEHRQYLSDHPQESIKNERERGSWHLHLKEMNRMREVEEYQMRRNKGAQQRLKKLSTQLAEFDTEPMPFLTDGSIKQ